MCRQFSEDLICVSLARPPVIWFCRIITDRNIRRLQQSHSNTRDLYAAISCYVCVSFSSTLARLQQTPKRRSVKKKSNNFVWAVFTLFEMRAFAATATAAVSTPFVLHFSLSSATIFFIQILFTFKQTFFLHFFFADITEIHTVHSRLYAGSRECCRICVGGRAANRNGPGHTFTQSHITVWWEGRRLLCSNVWDSESGFMEYISE